ncbi:unnamed protein product [Chondrus crispus]|uniref:Uncharacterized protein n=1 Tax=Chondrus crispus TaxID=2769 RepID=R7QP32_CHOCR|nr:unnamed protein product [Chondrus crispus]CDF40262.1 unnamed protein product [Chondrus crispus]|eukprot:XP_005710556.1 unnamed protein product [Chondrus crispus]
MAQANPSPPSMLLFLLPQHRDERWDRSERCQRPFPLHQKSKLSPLKFLNAPAP